jgi:hypothetical protein
VKSTINHVLRKSGNPNLAFLKPYTLFENLGRDWNETQADGERTES